MFTYCNKVCVAHIQAADEGEWSCVEALAKAGAKDVPDEDGTTVIIKVGTCRISVHCCATMSSFFNLTWCVCFNLLLH